MNPRHRLPNIQLHLRRRGDRADGRLPGIPIHDSQYVASILQHIADRADMADLDHLETQLSPSTLNLLRQIPTHELLRLAEQRPAFCSICVDEPMLHLAINRLRKIHAQQEEAMWFIHRGAPAAAMLELFGINEMEYRRLRSVAGPETRRGRTPKLDGHLAEAVRRSWNRTRGGDDLVSRFHQLVESYPNVNVATLWATIKEIAS